MNSLKNIQFVTGVHGDERVPVLALASAYADQIVGNKQALAKNKRFIEKDMNASFGTKGNSYEEKEARKLLKRLDKKKPVIDFHTNQSMSEPFVIIVDKKMLFFAKTLGISRVAYMKHNVKKGHSLVNYCDGVSVEVGKHDTIESFRATLKILENLKKQKKRKVTLYEVFGKIKKPGKYINFKKCKNGFVPLFAGKNSYNCYGLKARIVKES